MVSHLHKAQVNILYSLRHAKSARYSDLMRPTGLESDAFKFHLRDLVKAKLVEKQADGVYGLTAKGKEFANNLDNTEGTAQRQPKLTLRIYLSRQSPKSEVEYLFQERNRNPYWGYWDTIGGPVLWGESVEDTAARELRKQTGLQAEFSVKAFYRVRDYDEQSELLLEDKLFVVLTADAYKGQLMDSWRGGRNVWMTIEGLMQTSKYFTSTLKMITQIESGPCYAADNLKYAQEQY